MMPPKPLPASELQARNLKVIQSPSKSSTPKTIIAVSAPNRLFDWEWCHHSISSQTEKDFGIVLLLDTTPTDQPQYFLPENLALKTWVLSAYLGQASRSRNALLEWVEQNLPESQWVARMDWDDRFHERTSLEKAVALGDLTKVAMVLGGNDVYSREKVKLRANPVTPELKQPLYLLSLVEAMALGTAHNEVPSCNVLFRNGSGFRYPEMFSAEDHWLVVSHLFFHSEKIALLETPLYADYTLNGQATQEARQQEKHQAVRKKLFNASVVWQKKASPSEKILGWGQEGVVYRKDGHLIKSFYPEIISESQLAWLRTLSERRIPFLPKSVTYSQDDHLIQATCSYETSLPAERVSFSQVKEFLHSCLEHHLICRNIKRSNFRMLGDGVLSYIDLGNDIVPMDVAAFREMALRLFSIFIKGYSEEEVQRRAFSLGFLAAHQEWQDFSNFYSDIISSFRDKSFQKIYPNMEPGLSPPLFPVTLLIKACPMDWQILEEQVIHLVTQLEGPTKFREKILLIDPFLGPYLREYASGNLEQLLLQAEQLKDKGILDRIVVSPEDEETCMEISNRWFGCKTPHTHTTEGIPVISQIYGFEQVKTDFVLQGDIDVLVGRRNYQHNYLDEMIQAALPEDVMGVAFNIFKDSQTPFVPYDAAPGEYKPEVRLGLLQVKKIQQILPLPNTLNNKKLVGPWYRALHHAQKERGLKTVRGGEAATFYLHPTASIKQDKKVYQKSRDLVFHCHLPATLNGQWDLKDCPELDYPIRAEKLVLVCRGRNTPKEKIHRFRDSLTAQTSQEFGLILIDDASDQGYKGLLYEMHRYFPGRLTLISNPEPLGRLVNLKKAVQNYCARPETHLVILDLDDALFHPGVLNQILTLVDKGHDLIQGACYRPDAPLTLYGPDYQHPRQKFGGDVWTHLRSFQKSLFDKIPDDYLKTQGRYFEVCEDYATMISMAELAQNPVFIPEYWYFHERTTGKDPMERLEREQAILDILSRKPLSSISG